MPGMGLTATNRRPAAFGRRSISAARSPSTFAQRIAGRAIEDEYLCGFGGARLDGRPSSRMSSACDDLLSELGDAPVDRQTLRADPFFDRRGATPDRAGRDISGAARRRRPASDADVAWRSSYPCASVFVGRRRRHETGGRIAGRGEFFVFGIVVRGGVEASIAAVFDRRHQDAAPRPLHRISAARRSRPAPPIVARCLAAPATAAAG